MDLLSNVPKNSICAICKENLLFYGVELEEVENFTIFNCRYEDITYMTRALLRKKRKVEDVYAYQPFLCPIDEPDMCTFSGKRNDLLAHCQAEHPDNVIENSLALIHNINTSGTQNYILSSYQDLFLVQCKVCVNSQKLIHSVRLIADPRNAVKYQFTVDIVGQEGVRHTASGNVEPQGCLPVPVDKSVVLNIFKLRDMLGNINDITYRVTVRQTCDNEIQTQTHFVFLPYLCPIAELGMCKWSGERNDLLSHCWIEHSDSVIENNYKITHNIRKSSIHKYILSAYGELFFVQTKVCVQNKKIYYTVRLISNPKNASKYQYYILNKGKKQILSANVAPQGCLGVQDDKLIVIDFNSEVRNFLNIKLTVTIKQMLVCKMKIKFSKIYKLRY